jgi:hypothetical protein
LYVNACVLHFIPSSWTLSVFLCYWITSKFHCFVSLAFPNLFLLDSFMFILYSTLIHTHPLCQSGFTTISQNIGCPFIVNSMHIVPCLKCCSSFPLNSF